MVVILVKDVTFSLFGKDFFICKGTEIYVDSSSAVGYHDGEHFEVFADEYTAIH